MSAELVAFVVLIVLHLRWAYRESEAEKQRDNIRHDLLGTLHRIVDAQNEFRPMIAEVSERLSRLEGRN